MRIFVWFRFPRYNERTDSFYPRFPTFLFSLFLSFSLLLARSLYRCFLLVTSIAFFQLSSTSNNERSRNAVAAAAGHGKGGNAEGIDRMGTSGGRRKNSGLGGKMETR